MRVAAVTGARGLVGRYLVQQLVDQDWSVKVLTRGGELHGIKPSEVIRGDLLGDPMQLQILCEGASVVFHCAGEVRDEAQMIESNVVATDRICSAAAKTSTHLVHVSSTGVYGQPKFPVVDESASQGPENFYEITKAASERVVSRWTRQGLSAAIAQPTTIVAKDMPNDSIRALSRAIHRGWFVHFAEDDATANYILAADVARGLVALGSRRLTGPYILNDPVPANQFLDAIRLGVGKSRSRKPQFPLGFGLGIGAIGERVKFLPATSAGVRSLGSAVRYDQGLFERSTGVFPSGNLLPELTSIATLAIASE